MRQRGTRRPLKIEQALLCAVEPLEGRRLLSVTFYVDPTAGGGANNGSSWSNAFTDLQPALQQAASIEQASPGTGITVNVAQGTYFPGSGDADATFQLVTGVV